MVMCLLSQPLGVDTAEKRKYEGYPKTFELEHRFGNKGNFSNRGKIVFKSPTDVSINQATAPTNAETLHEVSKAGGDYFIRTASTSADDSSRFVQTFVSACAYYESAMSDNIGLHLNAQGNVQAMSLTVPANCKDPQKKKKIKQIRTRISVKKPETGPTPYVEAYLEALKKKKQDGGEEEKGFLQKYWMYLLPVYLIIVLNSVGGGGDDGGGGGGAAPAAS